jgi:hypothetical protein
MRRIALLLLAVFTGVSIVAMPGQAATGTTSRGRRLH